MTNRTGQQTTDLHLNSRQTTTTTTTTINTIHEQTNKWSNINN